MFSPRTTRMLKKQRATFSVCLTLLLLFTQFSSPVLAGSSVHAVPTTAGEHGELLNRGSAEPSVAYSSLEVVEKGKKKSYPGSTVETGREEYTDPVFASIVRELAGQDIHIAPTFVAEEDLVINSVLFGEEEPCVPVLVLKGYFHWPGKPQHEFYKPLIKFLEGEGYAEGISLFAPDYWYPLSVDFIADDIHAKIEEIKEKTGASKVAIVAYSLGGLVARAYLRKYPDTHSVERLITIATPFSGTGNPYIEFGGAGLVVPSAHQLQPIWKKALVDEQGNDLLDQESLWLHELYTASNPLQAHTTVIYGNNDSNDTIRTVERSWDTWMIGGVPSPVLYHVVKEYWKRGDGLVPSLQNNDPVLAQHALADDRVPVEVPGPGKAHEQIVYVLATETKNTIRELLANSPSGGGPGGCHSKYIVEINPSAGEEILLGSSNCPRAIPYTITIKNKDGTPIEDLVGTEYLRIAISGFPLSANVSDALISVPGGVASGAVQAVNEGDVSIEAEVRRRSDDRTLAKGTARILVNLEPAPWWQDSCGDWHPKLWSPATCSWQRPPVNITCHPDENQSVADLLPYSESPTLPPSGRPTIAVLNNGFADALLGFLAELGIPAARVGPDFSPEMVNRHPALFIPTAGLSGYANSTVLRARLAAYAANGGTIVALAQQYGRDYAVLPGVSPLPEGEGPGVRAYGYAEDVNCQLNSSAVATFAPMLFSQEKEVLSLNVDGYFTAYPQGAAVLLTRVANGQPSMLAYQYPPPSQGGAGGEGGWVLATTTYADMARYMGQGTRDERVLLRDLADWALHPRLELDRYGKQDEVTVPITFTNDTVVPVIAESITIYDPAGRVRVSTGLTHTLAPGESLPVSFTIPLTTTAALGTPNGVWRTHYTLYNEQGLPVQATSDAYDFAVTRFAPGEDGGYTYQGQPYGFSLTTDDETYEYGETATFTFHVFNHTDQPRQFHLNYGLDHWDQRPYIIGWMCFFWCSYPPRSSCDLTVGPGEEDTCQWQQAVDGSHRVLAFLETGGQRVASVQRGYYLVEPKMDQAVYADQTNYSPLDEVTLTVSTTNLRDRPRQAETTLTVLDQHNHVVFSQVLTASLPPCCEAVTQTVTLPSSLPYGVYQASTEARIEGRLGARASARIRVPLLQLRVAEHLPPSLELDSPFSLAITNPGTFTSPNNTISVTLTNPSGEPVWADERPLGDLAAGQTVTPTFAFDLQELAWGAYTLYCRIADGDGYQVGSRKVSLPVRAVVSLDFDQPSYRARDEVGLRLRVENTGRWAVNPVVVLDIPALGTGESRSISLGSGQGQTLVFNLTLPAALDPDRYAVDFTLRLGSPPDTSELSHHGAFVVPPPNLGVRVDDSSVEAGDNLILTFSNSGGVDTSARFDFVLRDRRGWIVGSFRGSMPALLAGGEASVALELPDQLATGAYSLEGVVTDEFDGGEVPVFAPLAVAGLRTALVVSTDQEVYLTGDPISVTAVLNNTGTPLVDGTLMMRIIQHTSEEGWKTYDSDEDGLAPDGVTAVAFDARGNTWFGTAGGGLSVLHANETWTTYHSVPRDCSSVAVDAQGNAWCGHRGEGGVSVHWAADGTWTTYSAADGLADGEVKVLIVDGQDNVWVGTYNGLSVRWAADGVWATYTTESSGLADDDVGALAVDSQDNVWVGHPWGKVSVHWAQGGTWTSYSAGPYSQSVETIAVDSQGNVWVGSWGGGVSVRWAEDGSWEPYTVYITEGLASNYVYAVAVDGQDNVWVGAYGGVSVRRAADGTWTAYTAADGLANDRAVELAVDSQDNVWVGHWEDGLSVRWAADGSWDVYTTADGLASDYTSLLAVDSQDNVWVGAYGGVSVRRAADGVWIVYDSENSSLADDWVCAIVADVQGDVWVGAEDGLGVWRAAGDAWESFSVPESLASDFVRALAVDAADNVWVGTGSGLSVLSPAGGWTTYTEDDGLASGSISAIAVDPHGNVWVGHEWEGGVSVRRVTDGDWVTYTPANGLAGEDVRALAVDGEGNIWAGTSSGVSVLWAEDVGSSPTGDEEWTTYTEEDGLASNDVSAIGVDSAGNIWCGHDYDGLSVRRAADGSWIHHAVGDEPEENEVFAIAVDGRDNVWVVHRREYGDYGEEDDRSVSVRWAVNGVWRTVTTRDGLLSDGVSAIAIDAGGNIWCGHSREDWSGVTVVPRPGIATYTPANSGLSGDDVTAVAVDAQGNAWFGTHDGGLSVLSAGGEWATYLPEGSPALDCTAVALDAAGNAWCGHEEGGVSVRLADGTWETYTVADGLSSDDVNDSAIDGAGRIWLATEPTWLDGPVGGGVSVLSGTTWITYTTANSGLASDQVNGVAVDGEGRVWFATRPTWLDGPVGGGVSVLLADGDWVTYTSDNSGLGVDYVRAIAVAPNGDVWVGYEGEESYLVAGVRRADGSWENFADEDVGFLGARAIALDPSGNVWFAHEGGVSVRWAKDRGWKTFTPADGLVNAWVSDVAADSLGNVWCTHNGDEDFLGGATVITQEAIRQARYIPRWTRFTTEDGLASNYVYDVAVGPDDVKWFATDWGVSRFSAGGNWRTYGEEDGLASEYVLAVAVDGENNKWFATGYGVSSLSAEGDWTTYDMGNGLPANGVSAIAVDGQDNVWVGVQRQYVLGHGYVGLDALVVRSAEDGAWTTYTTADGLASNEVSAIAVTPAGDVWIGHPGAGVSRLSGGEWTTYGGVLLDWYVSKLAASPNGEVWVSTDDGISVYSPDGEEEWMNYPLGDTPWLGDRVTSIAFEPDGDVWIGFEYVGTVWRSADGSDWKAYGYEDGLSSERVRGIAVDRGGDVWFATEEYWAGDEAYHRRGPGLARLAQEYQGRYPGGVTRYHPLGRRVLWQATATVSAGGDFPNLAEEEWSLTAASLGATGKLYLEGNLRAMSGQDLAANRRSFYVFDSDTALTMSPDRTICRPGQVVTVTGQVRNGSPDTLEAQMLTVRLGAEQTTVGPFDVPAGGAHPYQVSLTAPPVEGRVLLSAAVGDVYVAEMVAVVAPALDVALDAPDVVGRESFDLAIRLENPTPLDLNLTVDVNGESEPLLLPADEVRTLVKTYTVLDDATFTVSITGDPSTGSGQALTRTLIHAVTFGEVVELAVEPADLYDAGPLVVPYTLFNDGWLVSTLPLTFTLDGMTIVREHTVLPGQSFDGALLLSLAAGDHTLAYATPLQSGQVVLHVAEPQLDRVQIAALSAPAEVGISTPFSVTLSNVGDNRVAGLVRLSTPFGEEHYPFDVASGATQTVAMLLSSAVAQTSGSYSLTVQVLANGRVLDEAGADFVIAPAQYAVTAPSGVVVTAGEAAELSFGVRNVGGLAGEAVLEVSLDGIGSASQEAWLAPGEAVTLTYPFTIPLDLDAGQRQGAYTIGDVTTVFDYQIGGYQLSMTAQADKQLYEPGELAAITLHASDESGLGQPVLLIARLSGSDVESSQWLTLTGSADVVFTTAVGYEDDLLSYGLYAVSGRSLLLNTLRLRVRDGEIGLFTDKDVYQSGEMVQLIIDSLISGTISLVAPGLEDERTIETGQTVVVFALPNDLTSGTYEIEYVFDGREGVSFFEVEGLHVAVMEVVLDEQTYAAQGAIAATLQVVSNRDLPGGTIEWQVLNPAGDVLAATYTPMSLAAGRNEVRLPPLDFESSRAGTHALYFQVKDGDRPLATGFEFFDVTGPVLLGTYVGQVAYRPGQSAEAVVSTLGDGEALLRLWLDGDLVGETPLELDGYGRTVVELGSLAVGAHRLDVELSGGGLRSAGSATVAFLDLPQASIEAPAPNGEEGWYKRWSPYLDLQASEEGASILYHWDDEAEAYDLGLPIVPAEGEHTLYAHAVGSDGAVGPVASYTLRVDTAPPETLAAVVGEQHAEGWYCSPVTATLVLSDATSGGAGSAYRLDGADWLSYTYPIVVSGGGAHALEYRSIDVAGNEEEVQVLEIEVREKPVAAFTGDPLSGDESLTVVFTDQSTGDIASRRWDFGDGTVLTVASATVVTHTYLSSGVYTVSLVIDEFCGCGMLVQEGYVVVHNVPPTVEVGPDRTAGEGDEVAFSGVFTDPGVLDTHTMVWDFGDGHAAAGTLTPMHVYADDGVYAVTLTVEDDDGGVGSDTLVVTVNNVPPEVDAGPDQAADEGDEVAFAGVFTDPGTEDTHTIEWDFGDGATAGGVLNPTHTYGDDGVYVVTLTVEDDDGGVGSDTLLVTVSNVAPTVDAWATPDFALPRREIAFSGVFTDPGWLDTHTVEWDFGDGTVATGSLSTTHAYELGGTYVATLTVTDDDGGVGEAAVPLGVRLYPIALHVDTLAGAEVGQEMEDIYNGAGPGNFGWLSWTGSPNVPTLVQSLTPPGDSDTYVNPDDPGDSALSAGDWVHGKPGVSNAKSVRDALDILKSIIITVPVWDAARGQGNNLEYHVVGFARVQITDYRLPGKNRISAVFLGMTACPER